MKPRYICPKCRQPAAHRIRTRIGKTNIVKYTYFHNVDSFIDACDFTREEPLESEPDLSTITSVKLQR